MRLIKILLIGCVALAPWPTAAGTPYEVKVKCPIGGKTFTHISTGSYSTWGARPDGKPYGSWEFPMPLPVCPDNGLVVYREFAPADVAKLEPLVASAEYQALRESHTPYYRAHWLMKRTGEDAGDVAWTLLQASWQADGKRELKGRYQREFVEAVGAMGPGAKDLASLSLRARSINALRELGQFDLALARLDALDASWLDAPPGSTVGEVDEEDAENRQGWKNYLAELRMLVTRRDAAAEPLDVIPEQVAISYCAEGSQLLNEFGRRWCNTEERKAKVAELQKERAKWEAESKRLAPPQ